MILPTGMHPNRMQVRELLEALDELGVGAEQLAHWTELPLDEVRKWPKEAPPIVREILRSVLAYAIADVPASSGPLPELLASMTFGQILAQGLITAEQLKGTKGERLG